MVMRTHKEIIRKRGASAVARDLANAGVRVHQSTPQRWADRNSIPGEYWAAIAALGFATLEELAAAADAREAA
jgi:hypothetical protein